jgi:hypothetical protein
MQAARTFLLPTSHVPPLILRLRTNWAVCVDTSPTEGSETPTSSGSDSYVDQMRVAAISAKERVVAAVYFLPGEFAFESDAVRVPVGKAHILACKAAYRGRSGGDNIMDRLFGMVNARAHNTDCAFMAMAGIPSYCMCFIPLRYPT